MNLDMVTTKSYNNNVAFALYLCDAMYQRNGILL
jgi:hypothetical protein